MRGSCFLFDRNGEKPTLGLVRFLVKFGRAVARYRDEFGRNGMKRKLVMTVVTILLGALWVPAAMAQMGEVRGVVKDADGNPAPNLQVQLVGVENGHKYNLKTNKKGEFVSIGISLGMYNVKVLRDGQQVYAVNGFPVKTSENDLNIDLERPKEAQ